MLRIADFVGVYPATISTFAYGKLRLSGNKPRFRFLREAAEPLFIPYVTLNRMVFSTCGCIFVK